MLAVLVAVGFGVRFWLLQAAVADQVFMPADPDGYITNGRRLAQDGWHWTVDAIRYHYRSRIYLLPPLYPVFLSLFALNPSSFLHSAAIAQIALNALAIVPLFVIASTLHTRRAGLVAASAYALWVPNIWTFGQFMQEQLYVPLLVLAFALLVRATANNSRPWVFACAGAAFAVAALTRSMPLYYLMPASVVYFVMSGRDRESLKCAGALLGGFFLVAGAYSAWLTAQVGYFVFIENHGSISVHEYRAGPNYRAVRPPDVPPLSATLLLLVESFWFDPGTFVHRWLGNAGAMFHVHGDRWLHYYTAATSGGATVAKVIAHASIDLPFISSVVLAPLGVALARRNREAVLIALWVVIVVAASALSSAGGVRYRSPFEPHLIALASVVVARGWRRPGRRLLAASVATAIAAAVLMAVQVPRVARAKANYGLSEWRGAEPHERASSFGQFGLNVLPKRGVLEVRVRPLDPVSPDRPTRISIRIDDRHVAHHLLVGAEPLELRYSRPTLSLAYLEMSATDVGGNPANIEIELHDTR